MGFWARIRDGEGTKRSAGVTTKHALKVSVLELSAAEQSNADLTSSKMYRGYLENSLGSDDLNIDASVTPVLFKVGATSDATRWLTSVRVLFNGANMEIHTNDFRRFGLCTAVNTPLTNGIELYVLQGTVQTNLFVTPITTIGQFMDYADSYTNFINAIDNQSDFLSFDFIFEVPVVLPPGAPDYIAVKVADDLTNLDVFKVVARGYQETIDI